MILNVYAYRNKLLEAFGNFQLDDHEPDKVVQQLSKSIRAEVLKGKTQDLKYLDLYVLGTFNDETGEFINDKKLILDLGSVIATLEAQIAAVKAQSAEVNKDVNASDEKRA